jgi:S-adenosylmethionine decarboxylase
MDTSASPASFSADLLECAALGSLDSDEIADRFIAALDRAGAHLVNTMSHSFPKAGLTCVLNLRESHAVQHTWPETGTVNIDIFSCTTRLKCVQAIEDLGKSFGARHLLIQETVRANGRVRHAPEAV